MELKTVTERLKYSHCIECGTLLREETCVFCGWQVPVEGVVEVKPNTGDTTRLPVSFNRDDGRLYVTSSGLLQYDGRDGKLYVASGTVYDMFNGRPLGVVLSYSGYV